MEIQIVAFVINGSVNVTSLPIQSSKSRLEAEMLLSLESLISSSTGYIWPRYGGHSVLRFVSLRNFIYLKTKFNLDMTIYLHTARVYITIPWYTAVLKWAESRRKILAIRKYIYILTRLNLVVARNTTLKEVSCKVNEHILSCEHSLQMHWWIQ